MVKRNQICSATAIVVAAGNSLRMNNLNKQFILLNNIPILAHTLLKFQNSALVKNIIVVTKPENILTVNDIVREFDISKVSDIIPGGETRQASVMCGLEHVDECDVIAVHDGARPFVSTKKIDESILAANKFGAVALGIPSKDTVKIIDENEVVSETPHRESIRLIQTPQSFQKDLLKLAYIRAAESGFSGTDDCSVVEHSNIPVKIIDGEYTNIKITTPEDLPLAEAIYNID